MSRSPMFKAVLVTMSKVPFKLEPDIPEELEGRIRWAKRNYEFHKAKAESIRRDMELRSFGGVQPVWLPKQLKEEESHEFEPVNKETRVTVRIDYELRYGFIGKLLDNLVVNKSIRADIQAMMERLKTNVEKL